LNKESAWQAGVESRCPGSENPKFMKMNKQTLIALAAVVGTLSLPSPGHAAESKETARPATGDRLAALRERMQESARDLDLSPEQKEKLQTIVRERMGKLRELRDDNSLTPQEKREKFQAAREGITAEVKNVLTPEQFEKWKAKQGQPAGAAVQRPLARLEGAIKELNLTEDQKEKLKPLYQEQMEKLRDLHQDNSLSMAEKLEKLKTLNKDIAPQMKKVLDAEQFAKWQKQTSEWLEQIQQRFQRAKQN
jgi:Spy/CpxP family protein refolding chaperone